MNDAQNNPALGTDGIAGIAANSASSASSAIILNREDLAEAVRATATLADLSVSVWSGERTDRSLGDKIKSDAGAIGNTGHYVKNLLAGCDRSLRDLKGAYTSARAAHKSLTLPWVSNPTADARESGPRLLPNLLFMRYLETMSKIRREANTRRELFVQEYPDLVVQAQANLGGLAKPEDYPEPDAIRKAFKLSFDFSPIPAADGFRNLPDDMLGKLGEQLHKKQSTAVQAAQASMWERVRETVGHLVERLDDPKNVFKVNTLESVRELVTVLPGFNCTNDDRVTTVVTDIDRMLDKVDAKALRGSATTRMDVAHQAKMVLNKLNAWGL